MADYKHYIAQSLTDFKNKKPIQRFHLRLKHKSGGAPFLDFDPNEKAAVSVQSTTTGSGSTEETVHIVTVNLKKVNSDPGTRESNSIFTDKLEKLYDRVSCRVIVNIPSTGGHATSEPDPVHANDLVYEGMDIEDPIDPDKN